jgi:outer membrane protein TolC
MKISLRGTVYAGFILSLISLGFVPPGFAAPRVLSIEEYVEKALENDRHFEEILIDELKLSYRNTLAVPAGDLLAELKGQYEYVTETDDASPEFSVSLDKLFPMSATELTAEYAGSFSATDSSESSSLSLKISQDIAGNAFGRINRMLSRLSGKEIRIAEFQIIEAYEKYLAQVIGYYYSWYLSYENLAIGKQSYAQGKKLLENMEERARNNIALPVDVNKINIQLLLKKESLAILQQEYDSISRTVKSSAGLADGEEVRPADPGAYLPLEIDHENAYAHFISSSRTGNVLRLLEETAGLELDIASAKLIPEIALYMYYDASGDGFSLNDPDESYYAGIQVDLPVPDSYDRASYKIEKIEEQKQKISTEHSYRLIKDGLEQLYLEIEREKLMLDIASQKIKLSDSILKDEQKNYSYGKISLNDYIDAVNRQDEMRFSSIQHRIKLKQLQIQWLEFTDSLVTRKPERK